jgi:hypothetical protein
VKRYPTSEGSSSEGSGQFLQESIPLRTGAGKVAGTVRKYRGRCVLYKTADPAIHQLRQPPAWAWDRQVLDQAQSLEAVDTVIRERRSKRTWTAPLNLFRAHGFEFDRGHGPQVALPLAFWRVEDPTAPAQLSLPGVPR